MPCRPPRPFAQPLAEEYKWNLWFLFHALFHRVKKGLPPPQCRLVPFLWRLVVSPPPLSPWEELPREPPIVLLVFLLLLLALLLFCFLMNDGPPGRDGQSFAKLQIPMAWNSARSSSSSVGGRRRMRALWIVLRSKGAPGLLC